MRKEYEEYLLLCQELLELSDEFMDNLEETQETIRKYEEQLKGPETLWMTIWMK